MAAEFLSTLSLRRATIEFDSRHSDQNISIHALLAESDTNYQRDDGDPAAFLSTLSLRRATSADVVSVQHGCISIHALLAESDTARIIDPTYGKISIHALLAESDKTAVNNRKGVENFYPRSPCGERLISVAPASAPYAISIHALLAESDVQHLPKSAATLDFYPRSPCGERQGKSSIKKGRANFYPRSPCGERRPPAPPGQKFYKISIHALLAESDHPW